VKWLAFFALLASFFWAPLSAQSSSSPSTERLPAASGSASSSLKPTWERLDELLKSLEDAALDSSDDSARLRTSLEDARSELTALSKTLDESRTRADELSSSLERCERSLALSEESLKEAQAAARRRDFELWAWRAAAVLGLTAGAIGLGYGLSR